MPDQQEGKAQQKVQKQSPSLTLETTTALLQQ